VSVRRAERVYALLLRAYPEGFRATYEREMVLVFREMVRARGAAAPRLWLGAIADVARTAPILRAEALRGRKNSTTRTEDGRMKTMGVLAVLVGLLQAVNAFVELSAGGTAGWPGLVVAMAIVLSVLLLVAGAALLANAPSASLLARIAAVSWLALVIVVRTVHPWMSVLSTLLAVVFPLALLAYVWTRQKLTAV
jgi:hypothetical protein